MKRLASYSLGILLVIGGLVAVLWPVETWRMYDANWKPLAMTELEAYCSGFVLGENGFANREDLPAIEMCYTKDKYDNESPRVGVAVRRFCQGIQDTAGMNVSDCMTAVEGNWLWPLMNGGYTWEWNDSNPRPEVIQSDIQNAPRREGRVDDPRNTIGRIGD